MDDGKRRQRYRVILIDLVVILYQYIAKIGDPILAADVLLRPGCGERDRKG